MNSISLSGALGFLAVPLFLFGIVTTVFFVIAAWRAMKAHERIANNLELWVQRDLIERQKGS